MNDLGVIADLLSPPRVIALVGYSNDPSRPSNSVSRYLRAQGFTIIPVNPLLNGATSAGDPAYDRLVDIPKQVRVDFVDVFRRGEFLDAVVDDASAAGITAIWFQLALGNVGAAERAEAAGMRVVWDRCTAIEHRRLRKAGAG
ncbi:MAG TPA: CoA-binding protein [Candidatus Limnocylindria bacterium]|nr:CoA-binding protein [Candidatus Limnocylindria bacterium]